jgi:ABC-type antimicrobial peptide transport system permease subunit
MNGKEMAWKASSPPLGRAAKEDIPDIDNFCRMQQGSGSLKYEEKETGMIRKNFVDTSFFSIFSFKILDGNAANPFPDKNAVVISEKIAHKLFGTTHDVIGKTIYEDGVPYHVSAVMKNMPENTLLKCDALFHFDGFCEYVRQEYCNHWGALGIRTFFMLHPAADYKQTAQVITDVHNKNLPEFAMIYLLQPFSKSHFYDEKNNANSNFQTCRLFTIAVFVLLLIACINYVNLVTARMSKRNKEMFVKQIVGARKIGVFFESMTESIALFVVALIIATGFIYLLFPLFNELSGKGMIFNFFSEETFLVYGLTFLATVIFAGLFPAIKLTALQPLKLLHGNTGKKNSNLLLRRLLVIVQFGAAVTLIMSSIVITRQMKYMQEKDLGYSHENVLEISMTKGMMQHYQSLKSDFLQLPDILGITSVSTGLTFGMQQATGWKDSLMMSFIKIDGDFIPTMKMELVAGRNFSNTPADSASFILNETAIKATGITDPIGKPFELMGIEGTIIGVVKDFHIDNLHVAIKPLTLYTAGIQRLLYVRIASNAVHQTIAKIEKICKKYNEGAELHYSFLDESLHKAYDKDLRTNKLLNIFAIIAIFVSCLGLFGLVTYTAETKTKEIGIRKVMGATIRDIINMLSKDYLVLVGIAMLIAFPFSYFWLEKMLQDFAYRIAISWWMFALAAAVTIVLTLLTVGFQALKAAMANPVRAIQANN